MTPRTMTAVDKPTLATRRGVMKAPSAADATKRDSIEA